jgi:AcrR family transcriptional regulator
LSPKDAEVTDRRRTAPATKTELIEATKRLLATGVAVADLSAERVSVEAGMSRATFYLHFKDKRELIVALAADQVAWKDQIGAETLAAPDLDRSAVHQIIGDVLRLWLDNQPTLSAIIEMAEYDPEMSATWRSAMGEVAETAGRQFAAHWENSPDAPSDPMVIAEIFTWMWERSCHQILRDPKRFDALRDAMTDVIWRVLSYRQP